MNSDSYSASTGSTANGAFIRFNSSSGPYVGKGATNSRNITFNGVTLHQIPTSTDTEYTLSYDNGSCTLTSGADTITTSVSLTKLYSITAINTNHAHLKNIKIKPL